MGLFVQKYGGQTLSTPEHIRAVAKKVKALKDQGHQVLVIVSAMGHTTDQLGELARQVVSSPDHREMDMLLSTGERVSAALLSMALIELGAPAISFTGSQAGVLTNPSHTNAEIVEVRPLRIANELQKGHIVVLAGFQGVCPQTKEITTLGRGGSDTTAVAMANHFQAESCQILKDVDGLYTADPKQVEQAQPISAVSYQQLYEMTCWGAQLLHHKASALALKLQTPLEIIHAHNSQGGTRILPRPPEDSFFSLNSTPLALWIDQKSADAIEDLLPPGLRHLKNEQHILCCCDSEEQRQRLLTDCLAARTTATPVSALTVTGSALTAIAPHMEKIYPIEEARTFAMPSSRTFALPPEQLNSCTQKMHHALLHTPFS